jgi:hypothetical protein
MLWSWASALVSRRTKWQLLVLHRTRDHQYRICCWFHCHSSSIIIIAAGFYRAAALQNLPEAQVNSPSNAELSFKCKKLLYSVHITAIALLSLA